MEERIAGIVPHLSKSASYARSHQYTLIATDRRLIVAQLTAQMMEEIKVQSKIRAQQGKKGLFGGLLAGKVLTAGDIIEYTNKYWGMIPDQIIVETPGNLAVEISSISVAAVEHKQEEPDEDSSIGVDYYVLDLVTPQGDYSFNFDADPQDMNVLRSVLGEKLVGFGRSRPIRPVSTGSTFDQGFPPPPPPGLPPPP